jgi:GrpB-like predicted nucleotidyltransferase (UPF0157 family)/ribosomal protein S18 acetylase RimI-like enzyme
MNIRPIRPDEYGVLPNFLYHAIFVPPDAKAPPREIITKPEIAIYVNGFGRKHDCGMVAEQDGRIVGAAWTRIIGAFGYVDDTTPELVIAVLPEYRCQGIGTALLTSLFAELAKKGYGQMSLSVQKDNPAAVLYQMLGFVKVAENDDDYIMVRDLRKPWHEVDTRCLWRLFPIEISAWRADYLKWYEDEAGTLVRLLADKVSRISHIGSTAVPGLAAKPIVDILVEIDEGINVEAMVEILQSDNWLLMNRAHDPNLRLDFNKGYMPSGFDERVFHLHIIRTGDCDEFVFRDWLRTHPKDCAKYELLKRQLAKEYRNNRDGYTEAKGDFIGTILSKAKV